MLRAMGKFDAVSAASSGIDPGLFDIQTGTRGYVGDQFSLGATNQFSGGILVFDSQSTWIVNLRKTVTLVQSGNTRGILTFYKSNTSNPQCTITYTNMGRIQIWRGTSTAFIAESGSVIQAGVEFDIEIKVTFVGSSLDEYEVQVNGDNVLSGVGNLQHSGGNFADVVAIGEGFLQGSTTDTDLVRHFIVMDGVAGDGCNDFVGPQQMSTLVPEADGNFTDWTPSSGDAWDCIEEKPPDTDDFISASSPGDQSTFIFEDVVADATDVTCMAVYQYSNKADGAIRKNKVLLWDGLTTELGTTEHTMSVGATYYGTMFGENPFTSTTWTVSAINDLEVGVEVTA